MYKTVLCIRLSNRFLTIFVRLLIGSSFQCMIFFVRSSFTRGFVYQSAFFGKLKFVFFMIPLPLSFGIGIESKIILLIWRKTRKRNTFLLDLSGDYRQIRCLKSCCISKAVYLTASNSDAFLEVSLLLLLILFFKNYALLFDRKDAINSFP